MNFHAKDQTAMDIDEIQMKRGMQHYIYHWASIHPIAVPTVKGVELELLSSHGKKNRRMHGSISWIADGLHIEEAQITLVMHIKFMGPQPTETQLVSINHRREHMESNISRFNTAAMEFVGSALDDEDNSHLLPAVELSDNDDNDDHADTNIRGDNVFVPPSSDGRRSNGIPNILLNMLLYSCHPSLAM